MIMPAFNGAVLKEQLRRLDSKRQLAFGAVCCERLLPNYLAFQHDAGWGILLLFGRLNPPGYSEDSFV
jgi:uncharacterized protein YjaG (DUF416 family)